MVEADAIVRRMGFDKVRVEQHRSQVAELLMELPEEFMISKGGGMSFLNACMDRHGNHWGEHINMGVLFALGQAAGLAKCLMPREMWSVLPGGMPYYGVADEECQKLLATSTV